jgi:NTP pyrophosphatase (non-canonical NTP hydrolase)
MNDFQIAIDKWIMKCFSEEVAHNPQERNYRFLEEALELIQACQCSKEDAHKLVDYVFSRPIGDKHQETGGVMVTLAALCNVHNIDMEKFALVELHRINEPEVIDKIRKKQVSKDIKCG